MAYLPLAYINRFSVLTDLYCSELRSDCEPEMLLEMVSDSNWGTEEYAGPNKEKFDLMYQELKENFFMMHRIGACYAAAAFVGIWQNHKIVYEPDYDFSKALLETNRLRVYLDMIKHLPFNTFYLDFSKNALFSYDGFFVQVKIYDTGAIRISSLPTEKNYSYIPVHEYEQEPTAYADNFWIQPEVFNTENGMYYFDYDLVKDYINTSDSYKTQWFVGGVSNYRLFLLQFLMYLSSKEPDITESPDTINTYKPSEVVKNKYSEVQKWDVGVRYGNKIRCFNKMEKQRQDSDTANSNTNTNAKRPHMRKAHWEHYHTGKGRVNIITKWKEPIFVNGNSEDIISTIHVVTNKEAEGSSGEEFIKQYLQSKNISYVWQHNIRSIRKRYDFSIIWDNTLVFIEFDGEQHFKAINRWKGKKGYLERRSADIEKNNYCHQNKIPLLRIRFDQAHLIPSMIDDLLLNHERYNEKWNTYLSNEEYYSICE